MKTLVGLFLFGLLHVATTLYASTPVCFAPKVEYSAGSIPNLLQIADLNLDGRLDLMTLSDASTVSVLLGNGDGSFRRPRDFAAHTAITGLTVGDVNGDRIPDALFLRQHHSHYPDSVLIWLGNGDSGFYPTVGLEVESRPTSLGITDLNRDDQPDLIVTNFSLTRPDVVSVRLGNGDGRFCPASNFPASPNPGSVASGDFNRDGQPDLIVRNNYYYARLSAVSILLSNGNGIFGPAVRFKTNKGPRSLSIGDVNRDGKLDVAVANYEVGYQYGSDPRRAPIYEGVSVLLGNGDGSFEEPTLFAGGPKPLSIAIEDLNADGLPDLAVTSGDSDSIRVLLGNGDGSFGPPISFEAGSDSPLMRIADLNHDGLPDLAITNPRSSSISVLINTTSRGPVSAPSGLVVASLSLSPNPLVLGRGQTRIQFTLPTPTLIEMKVFDVNGRAQRTLAADTFSAGQHTLNWDGRGNQGGYLAPGVYFIRLRFGWEERTASVLLIN